MRDDENCWALSMARSGPGLFLRRQSHRRFVVAYLENLKSWPFLIVQDGFGHWFRSDEFSLLFVFGTFLCLLLLAWLWMSKLDLDIGSATNSPKTVSPILEHEGLYLRT